jgi:hypothetical protein
VSGVELMLFGCLFACTFCKSSPPLLLLIPLSVHWKVVTKNLNVNKC